jgi:hypothetical protein
MVSMADKYQEWNISTGGYHGVIDFKTAAKFDRH